MQENDPLAATLAPPTESAPPPAERPTQPPSRAEAEEAFRQSSRPPMASMRPGSRTLVSPSPLEPALAEIRGLIREGFERQDLADRATRRELAKASKANAANYKLVHRAVQGLQASVISLRREHEDRFARLEAQVQQLEDRLAKQEQSVELNRQQVAKLKEELEKARGSKASETSTAG